MATDSTDDHDPLKADIEGNVVSNLEGAPTIFIDGMQGLFGVNDTVKINLYQIIQELPSEQYPQGRPRKVVVGRLAMSPSTLIQCAEWLNQSIQRTEIKPMDEGPPSGEKR